jgi:TorA maturation chaperone TorD
MSNLSQDRERVTELVALYAFLARAFHTPPDSELLELAALFPSLQDYLNDDLQDQYSWLFEFNVYPYASVFLDPSAQLNAPWTAFVAGVYHVLGIEMQLTAGLAAVDHIAAHLEAQHILLEREAAATTVMAQESARHAQWTLLCEHILVWMPLFLAAVQRVDHGFYHQLAELCQQVFGKHLELFKERTVPLTARAFEPINFGQAEAEEQLQAWLSPAQSGIFISRQDIIRLGRLLDLPVRFAERRFMLKSLIQSAAEREGLADLFRQLRQELSAQRQDIQRWQETWPELAGLWHNQLERQQVFDGHLEALVQARPG